MDIEATEIIGILGKLEIWKILNDSGGLHSDWWDL